MVNKQKKKGRREQGNKEKNKLQSRIDYSRTLHGGSAVRNPTISLRTQVRWLG